MSTSPCFEITHARLRHAVHYAAGTTQVTQSEDLSLRTLQERVIHLQVSNYACLHAEYAGEPILDCKQKYLGATTYVQICMHACYDVYFIR